MSEAAVQTASRDREAAHGASTPALLLADELYKTYRLGRVDVPVLKGTTLHVIVAVALENVQRQSRDEGIDKAMSEHSLDALVAPSSAPAWSIDLVNGDARTGGPNSAWYPAMAGYPHITVPMGDAFGLPVGLSFYAGAWQEARLIELAYAFEQATQARTVPAMLTSLRLA